MSRRPLTTAVVAVAAAAGLVLGACTAPDSGVRATRSDRAAPPFTPRTEVPAGDPGPSGTATTDPDSDPGGGTSGGGVTVPNGSPTTPTLPVSIGVTVPAGGVTVPAERSPDHSIPVGNDDVVDFGDRKKTRSYDGFLVAAIADIESFWSEEFSALYGNEFEALAGGVHAAYERRTKTIPGCGERQTKYADVEGNAFYCSIGDFVVYDDDLLMPTLSRELGNAAIGVVFAHEFGHAVQARAEEIRQPTILKEQQADCFAGAWSAHIVRGENDEFQFSDRDVRAGLIAMIQVSDPVEASGDLSGDSHGTGFDRVGAFQDGFVGGAERCKPFFTEDRPLVRVPFDVTDRNQGDLPLTDPGGQGDDFTTLIPGNLNLFWTAEMKRRGTTYTAPAFVLFSSTNELPVCDGLTKDDFVDNAKFCPNTNQVLVDRGFARKLISDVGDMSIGYVVSQAYSESVQQALRSSLTGEPRVLMNDCLTGVWARSILPANVAPTSTADTGPGQPGEHVVLSAGDLDEAVITAIQRADEATDTNVVGSAFEKIAAFRQAVLDGDSACAVLK